MYIGASLPEYSQRSVLSVVCPAWWFAGSSWAPLLLCSALYRWLVKLGKCVRVRSFVLWHCVTVALRPLCCGNQLQEPSRRNPVANSCMACTLLLTCIDGLCLAFGPCILFYCTVHFLLLVPCVCQQRTLVSSGGVAWSVFMLVYHSACLHDACFAAWNEAQDITLHSTRSDSAVALISKECSSVCKAWL